MTFEEWFETEKQKYKQYAIDNVEWVVKDGWLAGQEVMRERAAKAAAKHYQYTNDIPQVIAEEIRDLPIE